jgi:RNA polymerase sigma-70 factor (ECF subfamily)
MSGFATTRWTLIQRAGDASNPDAAEALEVLCRVYWPAVYVYFRHKGSSPPAAADLTQEFFARVLEKRYFDQARRERGTFRTFLLTCAKNFLANEWDRQNAHKRGGGQRVLSLDERNVEDRYQFEPHHHLTPERLFEQQWAWSVLEQALGRLEADVKAAGRERMYEECRDLLLGGSSDGPYREIAERLELSEGALKVQVHRLRKRLRELVLEEIQQTSADDNDPEAELRHLLSLLAQPRE